MQVYKKVQWKNSYVSGDSPIQTDHVFFNFLEISKHFKGFQDGGFRVELLTSSSWYGWSFKKGFDCMRNCWEHGFKPFRIVIRFNKPIISFQPGILQSDQWRNVEVI